VSARRGGPPQGDDLFGAIVEERLARGGPLAARMRPRTLGDVVGQQALLGADGFLRRAIAEDRVPSMVLYGPPGSGKTTLARVVAGSTRAAFEELSATQATVADVRAALARARDRAVGGARTVLFIDEIHRFNKSQQDALLPAVEEGLVTLIGATTENPYYEVNSALVSRMRVMVLEPLTPEDVGTLLDRAVADPRGLAGRVAVSEEARRALVVRANGDARAALNLLEAAAGAVPDGGTLDEATVRAAAGGRAVAYDRAGDAHYDTISAFIKSMRASDPDAAVYYLAVMLTGGEDPKFIARRIVVAASEDVGNADPTALQVAVAAARAVEFVGLPEARINLAQAAVYVALAPKSDASYRAINAAMAHVERQGVRRPPLSLRDASRPNARHLGHGQGYRNPHGAPDGVLEESLLPEGVEGTVFYEPTDRGVEGDLTRRLRRLRGGDDPDRDEELPF
jgi:putative ATPase